MIRTLNKIGIEKSYLNKIKAIYDKLTDCIVILSGKVSNTYLRSGIRQGCPLSHSYSTEYWKS